MEKSDSGSSRGGFTLIEVVMSTTFLAVVCTGLLTITAINTGQMPREQRLEQFNYNLSARAGQGEGDPTGEAIVAEFGLKGTNQVREIFKQHEVTGPGRDAGNRMTFCRYR